MNPIDEIKATAQGAAILLDWIGEGGIPAQKIEAETRAAICTTCPENRFQKWWEVAKEAVADEIKKRLALKHKMELEVQNEDQLGLCNVCKCVLPLLVWTPASHLKNHTSIADLPKYPTHCWKRTELER